MVDLVSTKYPLFCSTKKDKISGTSYYLLPVPVPGTETAFKSEFSLVLRTPQHFHLTLQQLIRIINDLITHSP